MTLKRCPNDYPNDYPNGADAETRWVASLHITIH